MTNIYVESIEQKKVQFPNNLTASPSTQKLGNILPQKGDLNEDLIDYLKESSLPPIQKPLQTLSPRTGRTSVHMNKSLIRDRKTISPLRRILKDFAALEYDPTISVNKSFSNTNPFILKKNKHKKQKPREILQKLLPLSDVALIYIYIYI